MSVVKFNNQQWEKILALLKTCQNIYIGQENDCRNFLEAVFWITRSGSLVAFIAFELRQLEQHLQTLCSMVGSLCL